METKEKTTKKKTVNKPITKFSVCDHTSIERGDTIYLEQKDDAIPYLVIDCSKSSPYIVIENLHDNFCYIYHSTNLYKIK